jgi:hypothetical protein
MHRIPIDFELRADSISCCHYETFLSISISLSLRRSPLSTIRIRLMHTSINILRPPLHFDRNRKPVFHSSPSLIYLDLDRDQPDGVLTYFFHFNVTLPLPLPLILRLVIPLSSSDNLSSLAISSAFTISPCFNLNPLPSFIPTTTSAITNILFISTTTTTTTTDYGSQL